DVVHDLLAFLAERMTALNRDKSAAAKQFLTDLKDFHGIDAHALTPKTKLDQFWKLETAELFAHLKKNVRALAGQNIRLNDTDEEKIRGRIQKSKEKLRSEEHTSELQSLAYLVCRLLLEKKKDNTTNRGTIKRAFVR